MEQGITWGGVLFRPLQELLAKYGIDPVAGVDALIVSVFLIVFAYFGGRKFRRGDSIEPSGKVSLAYMMEFILGGMLSFFDGIISHGARNLFFLLGTYSFFILGNNLIGLVPGFGSPTDQYNVTVVLALMTFFTAHFIGIKSHGPAYIKKFMGPVWWLAPLMFPIEIISHLVRPLSLSMRLFGNMTGDHKVVLVFTALLALGLPIPFMGLGIFVSVLQTFVFVLLSCVYFQDALEHAH
ncbi:MAG: F0F1 ATP synthase subunit A [SAR324 cluster bacterium]|nr:F0F1 ATP synthase subunit A [SAR324 cluster bacterium]MCZ6627166.1 F0F1 ATP synthase subunit A [SAR324 cluster bacterium]MCZ6647190.1 F0F1 ATP synthase subunit A [SAR324 cluster bacterium]MCZ6729983.1 F0F1 ATP synthase subunit A [SAR324 cluster bacterium]